MKKISINLSIFSLLVILVITSCSTIKNTSNQKKGIAVGATGGALLGGIIGNNVGNKNNTALGAILGAAIGGVAGGVIGKKMDNQAEAIKAEIPGANVKRVGEGIDVTFDETNPDGSKVGIFFDNNKYSITSNAQLAIDKFKKIFIEYPDTDILIEGHTDDIGSSAYNESLSQRRALAVSTALKNEGVAASRISTKWYGETQPKVSNSSEENRSINRRVQFVITANEKMKAEAKKAENQ
ncbi:MAG: OmpA family protein [Sediminibacterium sp.]|nr:OmpA family protein [Sediminibacterium sp.]TXT33246.1 MAG: ompa/motb domain protein [Chitinophagaceae bacterium]